MSLLVVDVVPEGLVFAADRNLSNTERRNVGVTAKVLRHGDVLAGYVGLATVNQQPMDEWLRSYLERHQGEAIGGLSRALAAELEHEMSDIPHEQRGTIVHVGGF